MLPPVFAEDRLLIPGQRACPCPPDDEPRPDHDPLAAVPALAQRHPSVRVLASHREGGLIGGVNLTLRPAGRTLDRRHAANATEPGARQQGGRASDRLLAGRRCPPVASINAWWLEYTDCFELSRARPVSRLRGGRVSRSSARSNRRHLLGLRHQPSQIIDDLQHRFRCNEREAAGRSGEALE